MSIAGNGEDCNGIGGEAERRRGERKAKETGAESLTYKFFYALYELHIVFHVMCVWTVNFLMSLSSSVIAGSN